MDVGMSSAMIQFPQYCTHHHVQHLEHPVSIITCAIPCQYQVVSMVHHNNTILSTWEEVKIITPKPDSLKIVRQCNAVERRHHTRSHTGIWYSKELTITVCELQLMIIVRKMWWSSALRKMKNVSAIEWKYLYHLLQARYHKKQTRSIMIKVQEYEPFLCTFKYLETLFQDISK